MKLFSFKPRNPGNHHTGGFTLVEVMIVIAIIGILASIGIPNFIKYREKARVAAAVAEIGFIQKAIAEFSVENGRLPQGLNEINMDTLNDPWGRPYKYLKIQVDDESPDDKGKDKDYNDLLHSQRAHYTTCFLSFSRQYGFVLIATSNRCSSLN